LSVSQILCISDKQYKQIKRYFSDEQNGRCAMGVILSYYGRDGKTDSLFKTSPSSKAVRRASKAGVSR
jgi:hypothetical protein